jgi:hypothetical protein
VAPLRLRRSAKGVAKDDARAAALYRKGCAGRDAMACDNLAVNYRHGEGVPKDNVFAAEFYGKGCDLGDAASCMISA